MNYLIKAITIMWLASTAICAYFGLACFGFVAAFSEFSFMYNVTPFMGVTVLIGTIYLIVRIVKSNPRVFLNGLYERVRNKIGQA